MIDYKKIRRGLYIAGVVIPTFLSVGCGLLNIPSEGGEGTYRGHRVVARDMGQAKVVWVDGKAGGRLKAEDRKPFGNWDGLEDEVVLIGVSEADSLYRFVYPSMINGAYEEVSRSEESES